MKSMPAILNVPNLFTLLRVFLIPLTYYLAVEQRTALCLAVLVFSLLTDFIDGKLARALGQTSRLGAVLDPVADKLVVMSYMALIWTENLLPLIYVLVVYARNISQLMAIPILSWWLKIPFHVRPKPLPKYATAVSFVILVVGVFLIAEKNFPRETVLLATNWVLVPVSLVMEIYILATYLPRLHQIATGKHDTFE